MVPGSVVSRGPIERWWLESRWVFADRRLVSGHHLLKFVSHDRILSVTRFEPPEMKIVLRAPESKEDVFDHMCVQLAYKGCTKDLHEVEDLLLGIESRFPGYAETARQLAFFYTKTHPGRAYPWYREYAHRAFSGTPFSPRQFIPVSWESTLDECRQRIQAGRLPNFISPEWDDDYTEGLFAEAAMRAGVVASPEEAKKHLISLLLDSAAGKDLGALPEALRLPLLDTGILPTDSASLVSQRDGLTTVPHTAVAEPHRGLFPRGVAAWAAAAICLLAGTAIACSLIVIWRRARRAATHQ
jgi:hypothetical protein